MVTHEKIEEWIREVEERPSSAPTIIRYIANRLSELTRRNEGLLAENIELRIDKKVEDYESRIANLEYQVDLLKRQINGQAVISVDNVGTVSPTGANLILYTATGQLLKAVVLVPGLAAGKMVAKFLDSPWMEPDVPRLLVTNSQEELLLIFDSGRTMTLGVGEVPGCEADQLTWKRALLRQPKSGESLMAVVPVARMGLNDYAIQVSRRGFVKKIMESSFESFLANNFIGAGVKVNSDKPFSLAFAKKGDCLALVTREGLVLGMDISRLPFAVEEIFQMSPNDHVESVFVLAKEAPAAEKLSILGMTENGKVINRDASWVEPAVSFRTRGQPLFSKEKGLPESE